MVTQTYLNVMFTRTLPVLLISHSVATWQMPELVRWEQQLWYLLLNAEATYFTDTALSKVLVTSIILKRAHKPFLSHPSQFTTTLPCHVTSSMHDRVSLNKSNHYDCQTTVLFNLGRPSLKVTQMAKDETLLNFMWDVPSSNPDSSTDHPKIFNGFPQFIQENGKCQYSTWS